MVLIIFGKKVLHYNILSSPPPSKFVPGERVKQRIYWIYRLDSVEYPFEEVNLIKSLDVIWITYLCIYGIFITRGEDLKELKVIAKVIAFD